MRYGAADSESHLGFQGMRASCAGLVIAAALAGVAPGASAQVSVVGNTVVERQVRPGERYAGVIVLRNDSGEPQDAKVYQTDYVTYANGATVYGQPGSHARSNAKWIALQPSYVTLPPHATTEVAYTVTVPDAPGQLPAGTYWSMVMVEGIPRGSPESTRGGPRNKGVELGVVTRIRYAVQLATHLAGSGTRRLQFANPTVVAARNGSRALNFDIVNTGDYAYRPDVSVELYTPAGREVGKFSASRELTYPGTSLRQSFDFSKVQPGSYKALVVVDAGADDVFGAQFKLTF